VKVRILPSAQDDLSEGFAFYEKQQPGLGAYFLDSLFADIESLAIYYEINTDAAEVSAVLACRRDPKRIRRRLKGA
jgi:hypothetical protein